MRHILLPVLLLFYWNVASQSVGSLSFDGINRTFNYYLPTSYSPEGGLPLVLVLHGFTQNGAGIMQFSGFNAIAEQDSFIVVYPDGVGNAWNTLSGFPGGSTADDVGFLGALIGFFSDHFKIDTLRVFVCGFSAGGYMSHRLACESNHCIAAIAAVAGTMSASALSQCNPLRPLPVMQIHGTADAVVSYNGSVFSGVSVATVIDKWKSVNGCNLPPAVTLLPDTNTNDNSTVEQSFYGCPGNNPVINNKIIGGGHTWPGSSGGTGGIGNINRDINATAEIWRFFRDFRCAAPTNTARSLERPAFHVFPTHSTGFIQLVYPYEGGSLRVMDRNGRIIFSAAGAPPSSLYLPDGQGLYVIHWFDDKLSAFEKVLVFK